MKGKNFLKLTRSLLLIAAIILISACHTCPELVYLTYPRPAVPAVPNLTWYDIPGYYGLDDQTADFDDLQGYFDEYDGYLTKIDNLLNLYETPPE